MSANIPSAATLVKKARAEFEKRFGGVPTTAAKAPGRVNLIGEHTDYNGGFVFPMALPMVTVIVGKRTDTGVCRVETLSKAADTPHYTEFPISEIKAGKPKWANYVKGVIAQMPSVVPSFDAVIVSSVPLGGGVSSSASLEVAVYTFLEQFFPGSNKATPIITKVLRCQKAEHDFAGMPCGIMDQFISLMGDEGHALLLDCRSQEARLIPFADKDVSVLITNSNVKHELTGSEYPSRRKDCETAAHLLGVETLRDVSLEVLEAKKTKFNPIQYKRIRHVVSETQRTQDAAVALEKKDYAEFGRLMLASHHSLSHDFEVSCKELDHLVEYAMEKKHDGVYGSRMTGGGFGGCTVTLVKTSALTHVMAHIKEKYQDTNREPTFYVCSPSKGADHIELEHHAESSDST